MAPGLGSSYKLINTSNGGGLGLSRGGLGLSRGGLGLSRGGLGLSRGGLGLSRGGLGLQFSRKHSPAAYIASLCTLGFGPQSQHHLVSATQMFNSFLPPSEAINAEERRGTSVDSSHPKRASPPKLDDYLLKVLLDMSSIADKAHLLSVSSPHASSWLSVTPSEGLGLHLDPSQFQVAIKWWLGLDLSYGSCCPLCPEIALAIMLLPAKGMVMWFPATTNCVISLRSPAGELIWVSW